MEVYLGTALCALSETFKNDEGSFSAQNAERVVEGLKNAITSNPAFAGVVVNFPASNADILAALAAGNCQQAAQTLASGFSGDIATDKYNTDILGAYPNILKDLIPKELKLTAETTAPSCGLANGSITVTASGGTAPYYYSIDGGANWREVEVAVFENMAAGKYTVSVKDAEGNTGRIISELKMAEMYIMSDLIETIGISNPNARVASTNDIGQITVTFISKTNVKYKVHTFTIAAGFKGSWDGHELRIDQVPPTFDQNLKGKTFTALYSDKDPNIFIGFYDLSYNASETCTPKGGITNSKKECLRNFTCEEGYLPKYIYDPKQTELYLSFVSIYKGSSSLPSYNLARDLILKLEPLGLVKVRNGDGSFNNLPFAELVKALQAIDQALTNNTNLLKALISNGDRCTLLYTLWALNRMKNGDAVYRNLALADRKAALKKLAEGNLTGSNIDTFWCNMGLNGGEESVIKLLETTPNGDKVAVLDYLTQNNTVQGKSLLNKFVDDIENVFNESFNEFISVVSLMSLEAYPNSNNDLQEYYNNKKYIHFNDNWLGNINNFTMASGGLITLSSRKFITGSDEVYQVVLEPYKTILVTFENDFELGGNTFKKGEAYRLPVIFVYGLFNKSFVEKWKTTGEAAAMTALTLVGVSEIAAAVRLGSASGFVLGTIDVGLGLGDVVLSIAFKNEVEKIYPGLADAWSKVAMCYGIGRLAGVGLDALYKKAYVESQYSQYDLRLSAAAKQNAADMSRQMQKPENFAEFADELDIFEEQVRLIKNNPFVKGRKLNGEVFNYAYAEKYGLPPHKAGFIVEDLEAIPNITTFYCVEYRTQPGPGNFFGDEIFSTEAEAREKLALIWDFKSSNDLVLREYSVKETFLYHKSTVGEQFDPILNIRFGGGNNQFEIPDEVKVNWDSYFENQGWFDKDKGIRSYITELKPMN
jgi:hypothetical protein